MTLIFRSPGLATFGDMLVELSELRQGAPCYMTNPVTRKECRTVAELDELFAAGQDPSAWEEYAALSLGLVRESKLIDTTKASEARRAQHLSEESMKALRAAEKLYALSQEQSAAWLRSQGKPVTYAKDGEYTQYRRDAAAQNPNSPYLVRDNDAEQTTQEYRMNGTRFTARTTTESGRWVRAQDGGRATVAREERFANHDVVQRHIDRNHDRDAAVIGQHGTMGQLVRAMSTTSGSAVVPTTWFGDIIDRARNKAAVLNAGAEIVPMDAKTVQIGRLIGDPTAAFRAEGDTINPSDPTFDNVTLTATTMSTLVVGSLEWFQDADNVDEIVAEAIAGAFALQLDLVALYGSITSGAGSINLPTPSNPRGVLGTLNAVASTSVLGGATDGTTQTTGTYYNELLDLVYTPRAYNEEPNALIHNAKLGRQYAGAYDTTGQPLAAPADIANLPRFVSNQVPSYTKGAMTNRATDVFCGDWTKLLIGQRLDLTLQTLTERYAENGQVGIVAHWRGDIGVARPRAFAVYRALQGAA